MTTDKRCSFFHPAIGERCTKIAGHISREHLVDGEPGFVWTDEPYVEGDLEKFFGCISQERESPAATSRTQAEAEAGRK